MVAVCPPEDSNTALYHDLAKLGNISEKDKKALKKTVFEIFMESPQREYVKGILATQTAEDMDHAYERFQSLQQPNNLGKGFQVQIWNTNGTISTPFYGEEFVGAYYKEDKDFHIVLELPVNIKDKVDNESLKIELESFVREREGWEEEVKMYSSPEGYVASTSSMPTSFTHMYRIGKQQNEYVRVKVAILLQSVVQR